MADDAKKTEAKKKTKLPSGRHRSQIKRQRQNLKLATANRGRLSEVRTHIKKVRSAVEKKDGKSALEALKVAIRKIDKAVTIGILHRNNASRNVSRLTKLVANIAGAH